jgi:hypothetical protein
VLLRVYRLVFRVCVAVSVSIGCFYNASMALNDNESEHDAVVTDEGNRKVTGEAECVIDDR